MIKITSIDDETGFWFRLRRGISQTLPIRSILTTIAFIGSWALFIPEDLTRALKIPLLIAKNWNEVMQKFGNILSLHLPIPPQSTVSMNSLIILSLALSTLPGLLVKYRKVRGVKSFSELITHIKFNPPANDEESKRYSTMIIGSLGHIIIVIMLMALMLMIIYDLRVYNIHVDIEYIIAHFGNYDYYLQVMERREEFLSMVLSTALFIFLIVFSKSIRRGVIIIISILTAFQIAYLTSVSPWVDDVYQFLGVECRVSEENPLGKC